MFDIKKSYNSKESVNTYVSKTGLLKTEENIFNMIHDTSLKILDLGCGGGRTTASLFKKGFTNITGVDIAEKLIEGAKNNNPELANSFFVGNATELNFDNNSFDIVLFSFNGIDYIQSREERLKAYVEINRVLKKGGLFILSSHNRLCLPINRNLLKTILCNIPNIFSEYWKTKQSFGNIPTYYSTPNKLKLDIEYKGFSRLLVVPNNIFLFPFLDTFPYYVFKKQ